MNLTEPGKRYKAKLPIIHSVPADHSIAQHVRRQHSLKLNLPLENFEAPFILEYFPGMLDDRGQSMPHYDFACSGVRESGNCDFSPEGRLITSVTYLNSLDEG